MEFDFAKNIYLYRGRHDVYFICDKGGLEKVIDSEATMAVQEDSGRWKNYSAARNHEKQIIYDSFEAGWGDCTKIINRSESFGFIRIN